MAAMFYGINSTEPVGLTLVSIMAYECANFKLLATEITTNLSLQSAIISDGNFKPLGDKASSIIV